MMNQVLKRVKGFQRLLSILLIVLFLNPTYSNVLGQTNILQEGKDILKQNYVNTVSDYVLNAPDLQDMIRRLNDPYSDYFTSQEYSEFIGSINNTFSGIGIGIDLVPQGIKVTMVLDNSPALEAGVKVGDIIVQADGKNFTEVSSTEEAIKYIKGEVGSYVKIVLQRGEEVLNFNIQRRAIKVPTVESEMLSGKVAYISILSFGEDTGDLFSESLKEMEYLGANSYIIDLRYNGGGYMGTALDIAGHFIGENPAITIEDSLGGKYKFNAIDHGNLIYKPVIFLINEYSASASEILAAAVKDYNKAIFIGTTTYGKGVAQQMFPLSDGSYLKITVEKFYSPYGNVIHNTGVSPDFQVKDEEIDSLKVANLLLSSTSLPKDKTGYMRINLADKVFYIDLKMARSEEFWNAYSFILSKSASYGLFLGTNLGWSNINNEGLSNKGVQRFSGYKILSDLKKDISVDKSFKIKFNMPVDYAKLTSQDIELIAEATGKRTEVKLDIDNNTVIATPLKQLEKGQTYYLVVNDSVKDVNGNQIKQGTVIKYIVP